MKRPFLLLAAGLLAVACQKKDPEITPRETEDPDWIKLEIKTVFSGDEAYSIWGDIDKTLLVSTKAHIFSTSDQGKTWQERKNFYSTTYGFVSRNDTLFALSNYRTDAQGEKTASYVDYFTTDLGKTWAYINILPRGYEKYHNLSQPFGRVEAAGITYRTRENTEPIANSTSRLVVASDLLRTDATGQTKMRLPAGHYLKGLYLDAQQRLYVAASGLRFDTTTGKAIDPTMGRPAVVYISRRPRP
ncbi:hypothetical protein ACFP2F_01310 [Hymenobacter artigasi]|uniref:Photosystem II stability/assembly factor-like uncharacterized protein n=1 Tax=Hymenobacter artigasi TaxID=2719616 RepID=A0ABX1HFW9_9BACT|nr:hypothetical protein [Hymenobacter artigasi]NKI87683.1 photosystem II stability/assembly factor-like uncharacterized protein [Hymenobacter artigasi]